jgi:hypothetical protein
MLGCDPPLEIVSQDAKEEWQRHAMHGEENLCPDGLTALSQTPTMGQVPPLEEVNWLALPLLLAATPQCHLPGFATKVSGEVR